VPCVDFLLQFAGMVSSLVHQYGMCMKTCCLLEMRELQDKWEEWSEHCGDGGSAREAVELRLSRSLCVRLNNIERVCVCVSVCLCVCLCVCVCLCDCVCVSVGVCVSMHVCVWVWVCMGVGVCVCMHVCVCVGSTRCCVAVCVCICVCVGSMRCCVTVCVTLALHRYMQAREELETIATQTCELVHTDEARDTINDAFGKGFKSLKHVLQGTIDVIGGTVIRPNLRRLLYATVDLGIDVQTGDVKRSGHKKESVGAKIAHFFHHHHDDDEDDAARRAHMVCICYVRDIQSLFLCNFFVIR